MESCETGMITAALSSIFHGGVGREVDRAGQTVSRICQTTARCTNDDTRGPDSVSLYICSSLCGYAFVAPPTPRLRADFYTDFQLCHVIYHRWSTFAVLRSNVVLRLGYYRLLGNQPYIPFFVPSLCLFYTLFVTCIFFVGRSSRFSFFLHSREAEGDSEDTQRTTLSCLFSITFLLFVTFIHLVLFFIFFLHTPHGPNHFNNCGNKINHGICKLIK